MVGVTVEAVETPASAISTYNTQNAFVPVLSDWGPTGQAILANGLGSAASQLGTPSGGTSVYGPRTTTSATAIDAADALFNEDGNATPVIYYSRVVGPSPVAASKTLLDGSSTVAITVTAKYVGVGGNGIYVSATNHSTSFDLALYDATGNTLAAATGFGTVAAGVAWLNTLTNLVTAAAGTGTLPVTLAATALSGGTDNRSSLTLANVSTALSAFHGDLGPGQVFAPNWTNTGLSGISSMLGSHAMAYNRVAICDMDDNESASTLVSDLGAFGTSGVASYCGFWGGNRNIPGVIPGTTRSVPPSAVIAGLCARADAGGNPNIAAAGINYALSYATQPTSPLSGAPYDTYSNADLQTLSAAGINTFQRVNGIANNYGFVTSELASTDAIYWQFNHSRLRMFIIAAAQLLGQKYVFAQLDGQQSTQNKFKTDLTGLLLDPLAKAGALWMGGSLPNGYTVDTSSDINTPATLAAGQLNAAIYCDFSYFAQNVQILVNVQPITAS